MRRVLRFLLIMATFFAATAAAELVDKVVAVVNDRAITQSQINEKVQAIKHSTPPNITLPSDAELRKRVLDDEINRVLQLEMAQQLNITISDEQVNAVVLDIAKRNNLTLPQLKEKLKEEGLSYDHYKQDIHDQMVMRKLQQQAVVPLIQVSNQEVNDYLRHPPAAVAVVDNTGRYHVVDYFIGLPENPSEARIREAQAAAAQLIPGLRSQPVKLDNPAVEVMDLGWRKYTELPTLFQPIVAKMALNEVAAPIQAKNGFHVIKLVGAETNAPHQEMKEVHLKQILLREDPLNNAEQIKNRFLQIRARIAAGEDFSALAKSTSQDPQSGVEGGDLGWLRPGMYDPEIEAAIRNLNIGDVSQPIKTQQGWVIVQVAGRRAIQDKQALREAEARDAVFRRKFEEKLQEWLKQARAQAYVKVMD